MNGRERTKRKIRALLYNLNKKSENNACHVHAGYRTIVEFHVRAKKSLIVKKKKKKEFFKHQHE